MSEVIIIALLLVPILIVILILNNGHKKRKRKNHEKLIAYLEEAGLHNELIHGIQKKLVHQTIYFDESAGKLLVIHYKDDVYSHDFFSLSQIKDMRVSNITQVIPGEATQKAETITIQIGIEILLETGIKKFITFYDHIEHSVFQMADLQKDARHLYDRITKVKTNKLIKA